MENETTSRHHARAGVGRALVENLKRATAGRKGWYGDKPISNPCRYWPIGLPSAAPPTIGNEDGGNAFDDSAASSPADDIDRLIKLSPVAAIRETLANPSWPDHQCDVTRAPLRFAIVTSHLSDFSRFESCARAIADLLLADETSRLFKGDFRWVVRFEALTCTKAALEALVPLSLRATVRWLEARTSEQNKNNDFAVWQEIEGYWLIFLSDFDCIAPLALDIACHYARAFPDCRFIVPAYGILSDEPNGLIYYEHECGGHCLFEQRWPGRRVVLIRHDFYVELASEKIDTPAEDGYGLALKASLREPLLYLPEIISFRCQALHLRSDADPLHRRIELSVRRKFLRHLARMRWPQHNSPPARREPRAPLTTALCIVRTRGTHLELLREAVASILRQTLAVTACVVAHGPQALYDDVLRWLGGPCERLVVLHAWAPDRNRGYPANVALDFLIENTSRYTCFSFLDDDDILYPAFYERQIWALEGSKADIAYALSNQRQIGAPALPAHSGKPLSFIVSGNFIPIHCYLVRTDFLLQMPIRFREDIHYLEDWDFLLQLLRCGAEFFYLPEVLCEYRIIGDGNVDQKRDPELYEVCRDRVQAMAEDVARLRGCGAYLRDLADFDVSSLYGLAPGEIKHAADAWAMVAATET